MQETPIDGTTNSRKPNGTAPGWFLDPLRGHNRRDPPTRPTKGPSPVPRRAQGPPSNRADLWGSFHTGF